MTPSSSMSSPASGGSMPVTRMERWPRLNRCSAAASAPPSSLTWTPGWSGSAVESTITSGRPAARICSTSGCRALRPTATTPSTVARPIARASEPVQRRDEVERVAVVLGSQRDPLREGTEVRVREDDGQSLRREDAQRVRLALRQHPGHRVRAIAERIRNVQDPARRLWRQPVRAVERERHRRLRHARLAGDVGDARASGCPVLHDLLWPDPRPLPAARVVGRCRLGDANRFSKPV